MIERQIMTGAPDYFINRIPETQFDTSMGHNPQTLRVQTVPPNRTQYEPLLPPDGTDTGTFIDPIDGSTLSAPIDKAGAICSMKGESIYWGYESFGRCLRGTALETDPICLLELLEKRAVGMTIAKLRTDLPRYAKEHFGNELRRQVITNAYTKYSVAEGFPTSTRVPYFPAIPTGGASISFIRRIENLIRRDGWDMGSKTPTINGRPALQVCMGRDDIEFAIKAYKRENGIIIQQGTFTVDDPTFGKTEVHNGIQFIEDPLPTKGYLTQVAPGLYQFNEIQPFFVDVGAKGIIPRINVAYNSSFVNVGGESYPVVSMGFIIHPRAMERQAMGGIPKIDGKPANKMFNFEVNLVPDWAMAADPRCNKDMAYIAYRLTHAYAPLPYNPELMTAFLFMAANPQFICLNPNANEPTPASQPINMGPFNPAKDNACAPCATDSALDLRLVNDRACETLFPANGVGVIGLGAITYFVNKIAGALTITYTRSGGSVGASTVVATYTPGTATSPANFTAGSPVTISWADGDFSMKSSVIPINAAAGNQDGKQFTVVLSSVTNSTLTANNIATVTILDPQDAS